MAATSLALAGLSAWTDATGATVQLLVIGAVTGMVGLVRFAALRWLFKPGGVHGDSAGEGNEDDADDAVLEAARTA